MRSAPRSAAGGAPTARARCGGGSSTGRASACDPPLRDAPLRHRAAAAVPVATPLGAGIARSRSVLKSQTSQAKRCRCIARLSQRRPARRGRDGWRRQARQPSFGSVAGLPTGRRRRTQRMRSHCGSSKRPEDCLTDERSWRTAAMVRRSLAWARSPRRSRKGRRRLSTPVAGRACAVRSAQPVLPTPTGPPTSGIVCHATVARVAEPWRRRATPAACR